MKTEWREVISFVSIVPGVSGDLEVAALILFEMGEFPVSRNVNRSWSVPGSSHDVSPSHKQTRWCKMPSASGCA